MSSSPVSNASSSDLYSPSENPELVPARPAHQEDPSGHSNSQLQAFPLESRQVQLRGGIWGLDAENRGLHALPNGQKHDTYHKRKRDEDEEPHHGLHGHPSLPTLSRDTQDSSRTVSLDSAREDGHPQKRQLFAEDWSRIKQPNMQQESLQPVGSGDQSRSPHLPDEIWQHIFSFVPPVFLGRLLRVNRAFYACLTTATGQQSDQAQPVRNAVSPVTANSVWAASRKRFAPGLPKPLHGLQELEMWRLLRGRPCQMCGESKIQNFATSSESPLESGPGDKGVRVLWPFGIRTCGSCLQKCSEKESALYVSPDCPYFLLSALPFAFVTATNHFVSNAALQGMAHLPPLKMEKHYYKPHIEDIKRRLTEVKALGAPSMEEWMKGLSSEGKERHDDAVRWEQWEARGGLKKVNAKAPAKQSSTPAISNIAPSLHPRKAEDHSSVSTPHNLQLPAKPSIDLGISVPTHATDPSFPATSVMSQFHPAWTPAVSYPDGFAQRPLGALPQPRPERNIRDVNEAKAIRKAEIERRCQDLQPPLPANILNHMESFQAAIQISQPLTENAWEVLKPRLLAQRPYAERKEKEKIQQDELLQEEYKQRRQQEVQLKETKEALDREWDTVQAPVRNRISALADEIIADKWSNGDGVTKDTSPKFAADVLIYVRERFYIDIAREDEEARIAGQPVKEDQPNEPPTRRLILENMKWLFDTKIKPLTEHFQKELFLCNGCEGNFKFYGFEGVVQHYAAKHTTSLSLGSVVVHWRAEWPEHPPFHPNPSSAKAAYYKIPTPVNTSAQGPINGEAQPQLYYGYGHGPETGNPSIPTQQMYHSAQPPAEAYPAPSQQSAPYPYQSDQVYHPYPTVSTGNVPMPTSSAGHGVGYPGPSQTMYPNSNQGYNGYPQAPYGQPSPAYGPSFPRPQYPPYTQGQEYNPSGIQMPDPNNQYYGSNTMAQHPASYASRPIPVHPSGLAPDVYQKQLDELAKHAREVWFGTSGIKDIPQSVRIFVVIHHVASRFAASFSNEPTLAMFIDGLDNHPKMRPVRSLNGLACKTCVNAGSSDGIQASSQFLVADRRLYTLPHLLNHFRTVHVETHPAYPEHSAVKPDWKRDMIELPELPLIADLINAQGVDDTKLGLIASVFPEAFPNPLPHMGKRPANVGPVPVYRANHAPTTILPLAAARAINHGQIRSTDTPTNLQTFTRPVSALRAPSPRAQSSEPPGEDEYDPHRPAYLGKIVRTSPDAVPTRPHDHTKSSSHRAEPNSTYQYTSNDAQYLAAADSSLPRVVHPVQIGVSNGEIGRYYHGERASGRSSSQGHPADAQPQDHFSEAYAGPSERQIYHDSNQRTYDQNKGTAYRRITENGIPLKGSTATQYSNHTTSPSEAADQFLESFQISKTTQPRAANLYKQDKRSHPASAWVEEAHSLDREQKYSGNVDAERWNGGQSSARQTSETHSFIDPIRAASLISKAVEDSSQAVIVKAHQEEEYRPPSHVQIPLSTNRVGQSPQHFNGHVSARQGVAPQQYAVNDVDRPREDRAVSYYQSQDPQYRSRSRSPRQQQVERGFYRSRSPRIEPRHESLYHVVPPSLRTETQPQRLMSYDYPLQERYEYIDNSIPTEDRYGRRIEYLPVRYEESRPAETSRYILAPRYEEPAPPQGYIRVQQGYGGDQLYERDGHLYRADPGPQAYAQEYRY